MKYLHDVNTDELKNNMIDPRLPQELMQWHSLPECLQTDVWQYRLKNQAVILRIAAYFYLMYSRVVQRLSTHTPKKYLTEEIYIHQH